MPLVGSCLLLSPGIPKCLSLGGPGEEEGWEQSRCLQLRGCCCRRPRACGDTPWVPPLCRTAHARLEEPFALAGVCMPAWRRVLSKPRALLSPSGVPAAPQTWGPVCTQMLRVTSQHRAGHPWAAAMGGWLSPCPAGCPGMPHCPRQLLPQRAVSRNAAAPRWGDVWDNRGLPSPLTSARFLLFLFCSVGQVVNIKAKVNRAFNSSMEVGVLSPNLPPQLPSPYLPLACTGPHQPCVPVHRCQMQTTPNPPVVPSFDPVCRSPPAVLWGG